MNNQHYPKLELCEKLTEIDFPETEIMRDSINPYRIWWQDVCPSVMEMLDIIPNEIETEIPVFFSIDKTQSEYIISYSDNGIAKWIKYFVKASLADALAEMIIWLNENNYISFKENLQ